MGLSVGIIGLPNVGKSTLLNLLSEAGAEAGNYPFCTIDKNVGIAAVPDDNLRILEEILSPEEVVPATIEFFDIAGLVKGASSGEGLGNKFLGHIRETSAIAHVVRCFSDEDVVHVYGGVDPVRDVEIVNTELIIADLETARKGAGREEKVQTPEARRKYALYLRIIDALESGRSLRDADLSEEDINIVRGNNFLSLKPILYILNLSEDQIARLDRIGEDSVCGTLISHVGEENVVYVSAKVEEELSGLSPEECLEFLQAYGLSDTGLRRMVRGMFGLLDLITFYTVANNKLRAWKIKRGSTVLSAAGMIHSDMERGFIRAEVAAVPDLVKYRSMAELRRHGLLRAEGRDYIVRDEDIIQILFNV